MARRGFFAELQYQAQQAEKRRLQQAAAAGRAHAAAVREAERAQRAAERAAQTAARATASEQKRAQQEAARMHADARAAEAQAMTAEVVRCHEDIDGLLAATLGVDDWVDLEKLKIAAEHPPFDGGELAVPVPALPPLVYPPEPPFQEPPAPTGLSAAFGGKKKHDEAVAQARAAHQETVHAWQRHCQQMYDNYLAESARHQQAEGERVRKLSEAKRAYQQQCRQREADAEAHNQRISQFINDLAFDVESAIEEYVGVVLANSVYPDAFPVSYDHDFDLATRELTLTATVPGPDSIPAVKEYRYMKAKDEITSVALAAREYKDRYANAIWQVALRAMHEVFEADRAGKIRSIALRVVTRQIAPATGRPEDVALVVVAADRQAFLSFDLANVVPHATLTHLGAALSKSPFDLAQADTGAGVRVQGR